MKRNRKQLYREAWQEKERGEKDYPGQGRGQVRESQVMLAAALTVHGTELTVSQKLSLVRDATAYIEEY